MADDIAERMKDAANRSMLGIGTAWELLDEGADEITKLQDLCKRAPKTLTQRKTRPIDYAEGCIKLAMEYGEWYENEGVGRFRNG